MEERAERNGQRMTDVAREDVEALVATALKPLERVYCYGEGAETNERVHEEAIAALARLHSLLLRAEEERDHWKSEATGLASEQRVAEAAEGERDVARKAHDEMLAHYMELERELLRAEEERAALREALLAIREEFRSGSGGYDGDPVERMAAAALGIATPEETKEAGEAT